MRKTNTKERVGRKFMHYMANRGLGAYVREKMQAFSSGVSLIEIGREVRLVLLNHNIPIHWFDVVMSFIAGEKPVNLDHEYIALKVGDKRIFSEDYNPEVIKQHKGESLYIEINGQVSSSELKMFTEEHGKLIREITRLLGLPKTTYLHGNSFDENFLASLFREQGYPVSEVAKLADPKSNDSGDFSLTKKKIKRGNKTRDNW